MGKKIISGRYKSIYYRFKDEGQNLIIVLPRAGGRYDSHKELVTKLSKFGSVLFLETGYLGITKVENNLEDISIGKFYLILHELVKNLGFNKVILIGESVGAIHALNYASHYTDEVEDIFLSNPALYKPRWLYNLLIIPILDLGIKLTSDNFLKSLGKLLKKVPDDDIKSRQGVYLDERDNRCLVISSLPKGD